MDSSPTAIVWTSFQYLVYFPFTANGNHFFLMVSGQNILQHAISSITYNRSKSFDTS